MTQHILGINAFHGDSSACIIRDGILIAAVEEERFRRVKHWAGFPSESIRYCLREAGISIDQVDHAAINQDPKANFFKKLMYLITSMPSPAFVWDRIKNKRKRQGFGELLGQIEPGKSFRGSLHNIEHHYCHLSSAFHVSPFDEAAVVSVDGFGDFSSAAWGIGKGSNIDVQGRVFFPHSLGIFYQALTQFLGFPHYGDEYKVMGLAPYGQPNQMDKMRQIVLLEPDGSFRLNLRYFRHHKEKVEYSWDGGSPEVGTLFAPALEELLGPARAKDQPLEQKHKDLARSIQAMYEEAFFHMLNTLHKRHPVDAVAIAGGCGMNSVANGKVTLRTPFKKVYVQSAAGDAGGAIGAAYAVWHKNGGARGFHMDHAYWGPQYPDNDVAELVHARASDIAAAGCKVEKVVDETELCKRTAASIAQGNVVGWFQGRLEWGPRALGNRSIVCDPRRADMKDILNLKIKRRESFRPFAPSILRESVPEWFELDGEVPFMMQVYPIRTEKRSQIPAVCHVDGSGRLQTVHKETNSRYYRLIEAFRDISGVPMVLNTSFNENEPVVCRPVEALDCFLRTKMDLLVLGDWMVTRESQG
jgi:carbamoyltransferase